MIDSVASLLGCSAVHICTADISRRVRFICSERVTSCKLVQEAASPGRRCLSRYSYVVRPKVYGEYCEVSIYELAIFPARHTRELIMIIIF